MNNIFLTVFPAAIEHAAEVPEDLLQRLWYGLKIAFLGMGIVFAILLIIMAVLYLFQYFFYTLPKRKKTEAETAVQQDAPAELTVVSEEDNEELIAVISAAVAAYYEKESPKSKYRIRAFRRI